jgi:hypothetical protein
MKQKLKLIISVIAWSLGIYLWFKLLQRGI